MSLVWEMFSHSNDCNVQSSAYTTFIHAAFIIFFKSISFTAQRTCTPSYSQCPNNSQNVRTGKTITKIVSFYSVTFTKGDNLRLHVDISPLPVVNVSNACSMHIPVTSYK